MSDALQHPPSFEQMVGLIEKLFKDSLEMTKAFTAEEIEQGWQRYKTLNHLYQDESKPNEQPAVTFDSRWLICRSEERFKELEHKGWHWSSFYNGWLEGRSDMLKQIKGWGLYKPEQKENDTAASFDYKSRDWENENTQPASEEAIRRMKERWVSEGKRECPDCGLWFKSEGRCPECNPLG